MLTFMHWIRRCFITGSWPRLLGGRTGRFLSCLLKLPAGEMGNQTHRSAVIWMFYWKSSNSVRGPLGLHMLFSTWTLTRILSLFDDKSESCVCVCVCLCVEMRAKKFDKSILRLDNTLLTWKGVCWQPAVFGRIKKERMVVMLEFSSGELWLSTRLMSLSKLKLFESVRY